MATVIGLVLLTSVVTFTITYLCAQQIFDSRLMDSGKRNEQIAKIEKVLDTIENDFVGEYNDEDLLDGAIAGIVAGTGDRWSFYMNEEEYAEYQESVANEFVGIGVTVVYTEENGGLTIAKVHSGSSAEEAGLQKYDVITSVDGEKVLDIGYDEAIDRVKGEENTTVTLGVVTDGVERDVQVARRTCLYNPVSSEIIDNNIGYVRIENFDSRVDVNFEDAVNKLVDAGVNGLIFDVRDNGGGYKDVMVKMLDLLCSDDMYDGVIFTMKDKYGNETVDKVTEGGIDLPMTVIVNENSYSAAEFFAAALQEYGKADIVGTGTSGKGYSQVTKELGDGSAINISTNEYFTPSGKSLIGVGIEPDYYVEFDSEQSFLLIDHVDDIQLQKALEVMKDKIALLDSAA